MVVVQNQHFSKYCNILINNPDIWNIEIFVGVVFCCLIGSLLYYLHLFLISLMSCWGFFLIHTDSSNLYGSSNSCSVEIYCLLSNLRFRVFASLRSLGPHTLWTFSSCSQPEQGSWASSVSTRSSEPKPAQEPTRNSPVTLPEDPLCCPLNSSLRCLTTSGNTCKRT